MKHFNGLTPTQAELLALLLEELGEAQQSIGKILRHGYENYHPDIPNRTNRMDLEKEIGHVYCAVRLIVNSGDLRRVAINCATDEKIDSIDKWLHHS